MKRPCSRSTRQCVPLCKGHRLYLLFLSPLGINEVCFLLWYPDKWLSIGQCQFWPPPSHPWRCNLNHLGSCILLSFIIFCLDSMHHTLHSWLHCLSTRLFHHSIMLWIFRRTWKQPHHLKTPAMEWMESRCSCDLKFQSNPRIHCNLPAHTVFHPILMGLIRNPKTPWTVGELAVSW